MQTLAREAAQVQEELARAKDLLDRALERVQTLESRIGQRETAVKSDVHESIGVVERLRDEQGTTLRQARDRGQGPGLYKVLDEAASLDEQQKQLVERIKHEEHDPNTRKAVLEQFRALERQQLEMLTSELGKFEAQGLRDMLDSILALGEQQEAIIREILNRA